MFMIILSPPAVAPPLSLPPARGPPLSLLHVFPVRLRSSRALCTMNFGAFGVGAFYHVLILFYFVLIL